MNWGYKIMIVYLVFVAGILFMFYKASNERVDLVTTDYYAKELKYQNKIDETQRSNALSVPVTFEVKDHLLLIHFPKDFSGKKIEGDVLLYCPSDEKKDIKKNFSIQDLTYAIPLPATNKGLHELQITWAVDSVSYYYEKKLNI